MRWNLTWSVLSEYRRKWASKDWEVWVGRFRRLRESLKNSSYQVVEEKKAIWDGYHVWLARPLLMWWNASLRVSTKNLKKKYFKLWILHILDIWNFGHSKPWTFQTLDIPNLGHSKPWTFQTLDIPNLGHFKPWTFEILDIPNLGHLKTYILLSDFVHHFETSN